MNLSNEQKQRLFAAIVAFLLAVAAVFGYDYVVVQPRQVQILTRLDRIASLAGGGMVGARGTTNLDTLGLGDGTAAAPAFTFTSDADSGMYLVGANNIGFAAGGAIKADLDATDLNMNNNPVVNIGAAGTDFSATGGLTLADALTVSSGGLTISAGGMTLSGGATLGGATTVKNTATGNVTLDYRDYADTTDDDMAHAQVTVNCTDTGSGSEDCDYSVGVAEAGAAADNRIAIDADGGITVGSANNNSFTVTTDGTGTGEVVLPDDSIGIGEITNISRTMTIPLNSLFECTTDAGAALAYTDAADSHPHFANSATNGLGAVLRFDDTGGSPDTDYVCGQLMVPQDYAGQVQFNLRVLKDAETGANTEVVNCAGSINGAALGTVGTVTVTGTASQSVACAPTLSGLAAGDSLSFEFHITSSGTVDDIVDIAVIEFRYSATE